jgi:hypothetical protein
MSFMKTANKFLLFGAFLSAGPAMAQFSTSVHGQCHFSNHKTCDAEFVFCAPVPLAAEEGVQPMQNFCTPRLVVTCGKHEIFDNDYEVTSINGSTQLSGFTNFGKPLTLTVRNPTTFPATVPASLQIGHKTLPGSCFLRALTPIDTDMN